MTNEQAIKWLKALKANEILSATKEALDIAIQALEQNPCEITEEQAIDKLHETGWLPEHDKQMTERPHTSKTCATCMYYLLRSNEYPCSRCRWYSKWMKMNL